MISGKSLKLYPPPPFPSLLFFLQYLSILFISLFMKNDILDHEEHFRKKKCDKNTLCVCNVTWLKPGLWFRSVTVNMVKFWNGFWRRLQCQCQCFHICPEQLTYRLLYNWAVKGLAQGQPENLLGLHLKEHQSWLHRSDCCWLSIWEGLYCKTISKSVYYSEKDCFQAESH